MNNPKFRLLFMLFLTTIYFLIELIVGYACNSMTLVADAFHMSSHVIALIVAFISLKLSDKKWERTTYGLVRSEVIGALINSIFLLSSCFSIFIESVQKIFKKEPMENPMVVLIVGFVGLLINILGIVIFWEKKNVKQEKMIKMVIEELNAREQSGASAVEVEEIRKKMERLEKKIKSSRELNIEGVFLHIIADTFGSIIVVAVAAIIIMGHWENNVYLDPALSVLLVILISLSTFKLAKESSLILLQTVPVHIDIDTFKEKLIKSVDGILAVHDLHIWRLTNTKTIGTAHILVHDIVKYMSIAEKTRKFFHCEDIHQTTIQPEFVVNPISVESLQLCRLACEEDTVSAELRSEELLPSGKREAKLDIF